MKRRHLLLGAAATGVAAMVAVGWRTLLRRTAPEPLNSQWVRKPVSSARSGVEILADGRVHCWIEHEVLRGVTPKMLVWWFKHMDGDMLHDGQRLSRYRVWHPRDHIAIEYTKRQPDGSVGVGSVIHLTEMFAANPDYLTDMYTEITRLDEQGFVHEPKRFGRRIARMEYAFTAVASGTRYHNSLTAGAQGFFAPLINPLVRMFVFDEAHARAWIKHNIEEVGNFESFLPQLYADESGVRGRS